MENRIIIITKISPALFNKTQTLTAFCMLIYYVMEKSESKKQFEGGDYVHTMFSSSCKSIIVTVIHFYDELWEILSYSQKQNEWVHLPI